MKDDVEPAADGKFGRVLPGLQAESTIEIVGGFPIIEDLVTVLYGSVESGQKIDSQEGVECPDRIDYEWFRWWRLWPGIWVLL